MAQEVHIPSLGVVSFPDGMSQEEISTVIKTKIAPQYAGVGSGPEPATLGAGMTTPNVFGANVPAPTASGQGNPMLAALGLTQAGPIVAQGMQPGIGKALMEQVNAPNALLAGLAPAALAGPKAVSWPLRTLFAAQGAKQGAQALGERMGQPDADPGQNRYLDTQALLGGLQTLAAPGMEKPLGGLAQGGMDLGKILTGGLPDDVFKSGDQTLRFSGQTPSPRSSSAVKPTPAVNNLTDVPSTPKAAASSLPTPRPGERIVTVQRADGSTYPAAYADKVYGGMGPGGTDLVSIAKPVEGSWSHGMLEPGEKIINDPGKQDANKTGVPEAQPQPPMPPLAKAQSATQQSDKVHEVNQVLTRIQAAAALKGQLPAFGQDYRASGLQDTMLKGRYASQPVDFDAVHQQVQQLQQKYGNTATAEAVRALGQRREEGTPGEQATQEQEKGQSGQDVRGQGQAQGALRKEVPGGQSGNARPNGGGGVQGVRPTGDGVNGGESSVLRNRPGEGGFWRFFGGVDTSRLGIKPEAKVQGEQMYNRIRNVLGENSSAWKVLDSMGLKGFLATPKSMNEVDKWMGDNGPRVEVRKFGVGSDNKDYTEFNQLYHEIETQGLAVGFDGKLRKMDANSTEVDPSTLSPRLQQAYKRFRELEPIASQPKESSHWQSIAPKSEKDMPGYTEIAVVKPNKWPRLQDDAPQFPSSHSFPPNTLGFVRGYMETDKATGERTFHVIEVQSDWAQAQRNSKDIVEGNQGVNDYRRATESKIMDSRNDPLLSHYERLALKAAIDHAKKEGATRIAISDAETAMMTEGHDREGNQELTEENNGTKSIIPQEQGMRLHYDRTLPKITEELTGDKGQRVDFGDHAMAYQPLGNGRVRRKDLIFRDAQGGVKDTITARSYDISKVDPSKFTLFESDKSKSQGQVATPTPRNRFSEAGAIFPGRDYGVSQRANEERAGKDAPEPGDVMDPEELVERGRQLLASGVEPEKALETALKGGFTGPDVIAVTRAHGEQLAKDASEAGRKFGYDSKEYKAAQKVDFDWLARIKPLGTKAGESMRALQGTTSLITDDFHSMARSFKADTGHDFTPVQAKEAQSEVAKVTAAKDEVMRAKTALENVLNQVLKGYKGVSDDLRGQVGGVFAKASEALQEARKAAATRAANESAAIWSYAKAAYLDKGFAGNFDELLNKMAVDLGTSKAQIARALYQPKGVKELSDAMYRAMDKQRRTRQAAESWLQAQKIPGWQQFARTVPNLFFMDKIFGHGTVLPTTHAAVNIFHPDRTAIWLKSYMQGWKMAYSSVKHEQWVQDQLQKPMYTTWKRAGLAVDPERFYEDYQNAMMHGWWSKMNILTGKYGADSLKDMRINLANHIWDSVPEGLKQNDEGKFNREMAKQVAILVNHATGVVQGKMPEELNWAFFAPRLEASRWSWLLGDVTKALSTASQWGKATPEEKWFATAKAKEMAWIVGVYGGLLALNQGFLTSIGSKQSINFTNPKRSDFLSFKAAGHDVGVVGPMIGVARLLANLIHDSTAPQTKMQAAGLESRRDALMEDVGKYVESKFSPMTAFGADLAGQSDYRGRPLPWSDDKPPLQLRRAGIGKFGYGEYAAQQFSPIPFEEGIKEVWMSQGMTKDLADRLWLGLMVGAATGTTGVRVTPDLSTEPKPAPHKEPFQIKGPRIKKYSQGDIINKAGKQWVVSGFDTDGEPLVDEVGKEA